MCPAFTIALTIPESVNVMVEFQLSCEGSWELETPLRTEGLTFSSHPASAIKSITAINGKHLKRKLSLRSRFIGRSNLMVNLAQAIGLLRHFVPPLDL